MHSKVSVPLVIAYLTLVLGCKDFRKHKNWGLLIRYEKECGVVSPNSPPSAVISKENVGMLPWIVRVKHFHDGISDVCGGSIITNRYVLTAAHFCVSKLDPKIVHEPQNVKVFSQRRNERDWFWKVFQVESLTPHKNFEVKMDETADHDICLIRLVDELKFDEHQQPICLPTSCYFEKNDLEDINLTLAEWRLVNHGPNVTTNEFLRKNDVISATRIDCERKWKAQISVYKICTWLYSKSDRGTVIGQSVGDSGGPLIYNCMSEGQDRTFVVGVVSLEAHTDGIGNWKKSHLGFPLVNARVTPYIQWILENIRA